MSFSSTASFTIILPTYKRPKLVLRSIESVIAQTNSDWQLIVIQDSPEKDYSEVEELITSLPNGTYIKNEKNIGKNASVNKALDYLEKTNFDGHVVFLDDDDWLDSNCLAQLIKGIEDNDFPVWLVSNRNIGNIVLTTNTTQREMISYYTDTLITKRFKGDATHCISFQNTKKCRFSSSVKNGEEWLYFSQIALKNPTFLYLPVTGTLSKGYLPDGLTSVKLSKKEKMRLYFKILNELVSRRILNIYTGLYMFLRFGKIFF